ncbi:MAG: SDR family NAD(P)-dependent oxidoreductase, partial [Rhizobiales bacterium]|nr:SDR family NAD(P)-dependent oxidoreductase [Hyphomicrobiales bacterium]
MGGKVVVVTGASGALGATVVAALRARGDRVGAVDHAASTTPPTAELFRAGGVDLSNATQAAAAVDAVARHFGQRDGLI